MAGFVVEGLGWGLIAILSDLEPKSSKLQEFRQWCGLIAEALLALKHPRTRHEELHFNVFTGKRLHRDEDFSTKRNKQISHSERKQE